MTIQSVGYAPQRDSAADEKLFFDNIELLLGNEEAILGCADYFFCRLTYFFCSWPYLGGDGPLFVGYLLLAWREGWLTETCDRCAGTILVTFFGGSFGGNSWSGTCRQCGAKQRGTDSPLFRDRESLIQAMRSSFPFELRSWEEFDGAVFSWGGNGLKPARRKRLVVKRTADPVSLAQLIADLASGNVRQGNPPNVRLLKGEPCLKFSLKNGAIAEFSIGVCRK